MGKRKTLKNQWFSFFFFSALLGGLEEVSEASLGMSWAMLARRSDFSAHFWTCWRQDGEKDGQDGDQEAQDGRWKAKMGLQIHATSIRLISIAAMSRGLGPLKD